MIDPETQQTLRQRFNPDGSQLRLLQLRLLDMLKYIDKVCRENNIHYWISSGTALGAVRHGGFIPWDDDADIELLKPDYKKLIKVLKANPDKRYVLQDHSTDIEYSGVVGKLRDTQSTVLEYTPGEEYYTHKGVFIDLFCIEPSNSPKLNRISHIIQVLGLYYVGRIRYRFIRHSLMRFNRMWICGLLFPALSLIGRIGNKERLRHVIGSGFPAPRRYSEVCQSIYVDFEDTKLPVPYKVHEYLTRMFGDYNKLPEIDKIRTHIKNSDF